MMASRAQHCRDEGVPEVPVLKPSDESIKAQKKARKERQEKRAVDRGAAEGAGCPESRSCPGIAGDGHANGRSADDRTELAHTSIDARAPKPHGLDHQPYHC